MRHLKILPPLVLLALASLASADATIFTGHGDTFGPPFPTDTIGLTVRNDGGTPLQAIIVSLPEASANSGAGMSITSGGLTAHLITSKLENYDYPGEYAQRFDGIDPAGTHSHPTVLGSIFNSGSFEASLQFDLSPDSPEQHLYYVLRGQIFPDQPVSFSNVSLTASPQGYIDLKLVLLPNGQILDAPVVQLDLVGSNAPLPEPSMILIPILALLAASRVSRYHSARNG